MVIDDGRDGVGEPAGLGRLWTSAIRALGACRVAMSRLRGRLSPRLRLVGSPTPIWRTPAVWRSVASRRVGVEAGELECPLQLLFLATEYIIPRPWRRWRALVWEAMIYSERQHMRMRLPPCPADSL